VRVKSQILVYLLAGFAPAVLLAPVGLHALLHRPWLTAFASVALVLGGVCAISAAVARADDVLHSLANHLEALRSGDLGRRLKVRPGRDGFASAAGEANALGDQLREQRYGAVEAAALLRTVMGEIDVALFAVDQDGAIGLANAAGARLLRRSSADLLGKSVQEVGLGLLVEGAAPRTFAATFPGASGRWELRRRSFRERGRKHQLIVLAEVSRALREEESLAWQRLVRVLGHEMNNSLTPICSIAASLAELLADDPLPPDWRTDVSEGLMVVAGRAAALGRFMTGYTRLAQLPPPNRSLVRVGPWIRCAAALETGVEVAITPGPPVELLADPDQLDQLLINLLKNAAEASLETGGKVSITWSLDGQLEVRIEDEGLGLASDANLFVPFFTTKPGGSGIGLVLSRQIAEKHGGTLALSNRPDRQGCRAVLRLPLAPATDDGPGR
jgi:two-component system, NtrC family, nitrogen regulation sensor histidine kinase NtrY